MIYTDDCTLPAGLLEQIADQGFDTLPKLIRNIIIAAVQAERQKYLQAAPFEHSRSSRVMPMLQTENGQDLVSPAGSRMYI